MGIVSLKKNKKENMVVVARVSADIIDTLKENNVNISKTIREYLVSVVSNLKSMRKGRKVS